MENTKETKTYRYESEVVKHAESNPLIPSFSEWACDRYRKEFMEIETLAKKTQMYTDMANSCKERLVELREQKKQGKNIGILRPHEREWIKTKASDRIERSTFEGVYKYFCRKYGREDINRRQFRLFVEQLSKKAQ